MSRFQAQTTASLDEELLLPGLVVDDKPRRPVAIFRVHVVGPQIERFENVAIGVDDIVGAAGSHFANL